MIRVLMVIAVQGIKLLAVYYVVYYVVYLSTCTCMYMETLHKYQNKIQSVVVLTILSYKWNFAQHYSDIKTIKTFSKK